MMGHRFREEKEVVRILHCPEHGRKRPEKRLDLAAPSLPLTHHPYGSGAPSYKVRQVPVRGLFTWAEGARAGEERTSGLNPLWKRTRPAKAALGSHELG